MKHTVAILFVFLNTLIFSQEFKAYAVDNINTPDNRFFTEYSNFNIIIDSTSITLPFTDEIKIVSRKGDLLIAMFEGEKYSIKISEFKIEVLNINSQETKIYYLVK